MIDLKEVNIDFKYRNIRNVFTELYVPSSVVLLVNRFLGTRHHNCSSGNSTIEFTDKNISIRICLVFYYKLVKISGGITRQSVLDVYQGNTLVFIFAS